MIFSNQAHFDHIAEDQTSLLQAKLNQGLPSILKEFGVRHIVGLPRSSPRKT